MLGTESAFSKDNSLWLPLRTSSPRACFVLFEAQLFIATRLGRTDLVGIRLAFFALPS